LDSSEVQSGASESAWIELLFAESAEVHSVVITRADNGASEFGVTLEPGKRGYKASADEPLTITQGLHAMKVRITAKDRNPLCLRSVRLFGREGRELLGAVRPDDTATVWKRLTVSARDHDAQELAGPGLVHEGRGREPAVSIRRGDGKAWLQVEFTDGTVAPRAYLMGNVSGCELTKWTLKGQTDEDVWMCLDEQDNRQERQQGPDGTVTYPIKVDDENARFRVLKLIVKEANGAGNFVLSRFDVFGEFRYDGGRGAGA